MCACRCDVLRDDYAGLAGPKSRMASIALRMEGLDSMKRLLLAAAAVILTQSAALAAAPADLDEVSLRLGGKDVSLSAPLRERLAGLARQILERCGPNTRHHPGNFGPAAKLASERSERALAGSRLRVVYAHPFQSFSHLGGTVPVTEAVIGLEDPELFVGPDFTRQPGAPVEHLQCGYLPSLELACLPELAPHLPSRYRETCARLERDTGGRIVMPPPDIAPSCS